MSVDTVLDALKEKRLRITPQRVQVIRLLFKLSHPSAEQIYMVMAEEFPYVSQATVYNTLNLLKEHGIVNELNHSNRSSHYEIAGKPHSHFNCKECGKIIDIPAADEDMLQNITKRNETFRIDSFRIELFGACPDCR